MGINYELQFSVWAKTSLGLYENVLLPVIKVQIKVIRAKFVEGGEVEQMN